MAIGSLPSIPSNLPENSTQLVFGGYFSTGSYTSPKTYTPGLYILKGYTLNEVDSKLLFTFGQNNVSYISESGKEKYIYITTSESSLVVSPYASGTSSVTRYKQIAPATLGNNASNGFGMLGQDRNIKNYLVLGAMYGGAQLSLDAGRTWHVVAGNTGPSNTTMYPPSIAYNENITNKFIVLYGESNANRTAYKVSTDGITWEESTNTFPGNFGMERQRVVKTINNLYFAVSYNGGGSQQNVFSSTDGVTWTAFTPTSNLGISDIDYIGSRYVVCGYRGYVATSTDLVTWTVPSIGHQTTNNSYIFHKLILQNSKLVMISNYTDFYTTTDGVTFTIQGTQPGGGQYPNPSVVTSDSQNFVKLNGRLIYAKFGTGFMEYLDNTNLKGLVSSQSYGSPYQPGSGATIHTYAYGNNTYIAGAENVTNKVFTSTNLVTWTGRGTTNLPATPRCSVYGTVFVLAGDSGALSTSTDGITWTSRTSQFGTTRIDCLAYESSLTNKYVAVGREGKISYSTDAVTWTAVTPIVGPLSGSSANMIFLDVLFAGGKYVAVAVDNSGTNSANQSAYVYTSTNGSTWTNSATVSSANFGRIVYFNNKYFAMQGMYAANLLGSAYYKNQIWSSTDAITWSLYTLPSDLVLHTQSNNWTSAFMGMVAGSTYLHLTSYDYDIRYISTDGTTWYTHPLYSENQTQPSTRVMSDGTNVYVGNYAGYFRVNNNGVYPFISQNDGLTFTVNYAANIDQGDLPSVYYNGSNYIATGRYGNSISFGTFGSVWGSFTALKYESTTGIALTQLASSSSDGSKILARYDNPGNILIVSQNSGSTWQFVKVTPASGSSLANAPIVSGKNFFMTFPSTVGNGSEIFLSYSTDGITWTDISAGFANYTGYSYNFLGGAYNISTNTFVFFARSYITPSNIAYHFLYTVNGNDFSVTSTNNTSVSGNTTSFVMSYGNNNFVHAANGTNPTASQTFYISDRNGKNWANKAVATANSYVRGLAYGNGIWVLITSSGSYYTSPDLTTWTARTTLTSAIPNSLSFNNGIFTLITEQSGWIYTSPDGLTWTLFTFVQNNVLSYQYGATVTPSINKNLVFSGPGITINYSPILSQAGVGYLYKTNSLVY